TYTVTVADANSCTASSVAVVNCMVGVQENNLPGLKITPNPASSSVTIERGIHTPCTIQLVNMLGETLYSTGEITTDRITIDMGLMPKGIYFVEVTDKLSNSRILGKVVLQ
ncbi:MAG: T9SS type A sorting domain-containing protein, partial [Bacteroidia bacterium]|nr:T9SS type A sorting domain-containing protein [Bacteroidia bacterium]